MSVELASAWEGATDDSGSTRRVIAIDGPAAAGKSTVARLLAERLGLLLFDTGALYRAVTLAAIQSNTSFGNEQGLATIAGGQVIDIGSPSQSDGRLYDVRLNGEDVTWLIRGADVDAGVSQVSAHAKVRAALLPIQRQIAATQPVVIVGRDIGTVIVPDASVKIFLEASLEERAKRRHVESTGRGSKATFEQIVADLQRRDAIDQGRVASPLRAATDAIIVPTDGLTVEQVVDRIEPLVHKSWAIDKGDRTSGKMPDRHS